MQNKVKVETALFIPTAKAGGFSAHLVIFISLRGRSCSLPEAIPCF
jgi:hypothetical protein